MTDFRNAKEKLCRTITRWGSATGTRDHARAWQEIEDAITALDNAAYDRGSASEKYESGQLRMERDVARMARDELQRQFDERGRERDRLQEERNSARQYGYDLREAENTYLLGERDRLQVELADARETIKRLASGGDISPLRRDLETERTHRRALQEKIAALRTRMNLVEEETTANFDEMADWQADALNLRKALETLADRYHFELCRMCSGEKSRQECGMKDGALRKAVEALAGESEPSRVTTAKLTGGEITIDGVLHDVLPNGCLMPRSSAAASDTVREMARAIVDDRKPKEQPEIEAVLMGTRKICSCGCYQSIAVGHVAYRFVGQTWAGAPLYASEACARRAARPKARTHPPYAAYTDAMLREEEAAQKPPEAPTTPHLKVVYECSGSDGCGWSGSTRDLSPRGRCPKCWRDVSELDVVEKRQP